MGTKSLKKPNPKSGKVSPAFPGARDYIKRQDKNFEYPNKGTKKGKVSKSPKSAS